MLVDSDEDEDAVGRDRELARARARRLDDDEHLHARAARVDDARVRLHEVSGRNRPREVHVAHVGGHAVARAPPDGARVAGPVDPLQHAPRGDGLPADRGVHGLGEELQRDAISASLHTMIEPLPGG